MKWRPGGNKYKVSPPDQRTWRGRCYASKAEMEYAVLLASTRTWTREQPVVLLGPSQIRYVPDFAVYGDTEDPIYIDIKGMETPEFKLKKKLWAAHGPGNLHIVKKSGKKFKTTEIVQGGHLHGCTVNAGIGSGAGEAA